MPATDSPSHRIRPQDSDDGRESNRADDSDARNPKKVRPEDQSSRIRERVPTVSNPISLSEKNQTRQYLVLS